MFGKEYFEKILPEQVNGIGASATVKVWLVGHQEPVDVRAVFAVHPTFVILEIFPERERPGWQEGSAPEDRWVFDQLAVPYETISHTEVTIREPEQDGTKPIGFRE